MVWARKEVNTAAGSVNWEGKQPFEDCKATKGQVMKSATVLVVVGVLVVGLAIGRAQDEARPPVSDSVMPEGATVLGTNSITVRKSKPKVNIETIKLQFARAAELATVVEQLFKDESVAIAAEPSSNSIMVRGQADIIKQIQTLVAELDARAQKRTIKRKNVARGGVSSTSNPFARTTTGSNRAVNKRTVVEFQPGAVVGAARQFGNPNVVGAIPGVVQRFPSGATVIGQAKPMTVEATIRTSTQYSRWEVESQKIAAKIRKRPKNQDSNGNDEKKLREAIGKAFDARQASRRAEAKKLRDRLDKIEERIERQQEAKKEIVNTRYNELIHPEYRWNSVGAISGGIQRLPVAATPPGVPDAAIGILGPAVLPSRALPPGIAAPVGRPATLPQPTAPSSARRRNNAKLFQLRPRASKTTQQPTATPVVPATAVDEPETPVKTPAGFPAEDEPVRAKNRKDPSSDSKDETATEPNTDPEEPKRKKRR